MSSALVTALTAAGLRTEPDVSVPRAQIARLAATAAPEPALEPVLDAVLEAYAALDKEDRGPVLTHGDVGLHNMALDPETGRLLGLFDFEEAAVALATGDPEWVARRLRWVRGALAYTPGRLLGLAAAGGEAVSRAETRTSD